MNMFIRFRGGVKLRSRQPCMRKKFRNTVRKWIILPIQFVSFVKFFERTGRRFPVLVADGWCYDSFERASSPNLSKTRNCLYSSNISSIHPNIIISCCMTTPDSITSIWNLIETIKIHAPRLSIANIEREIQVLEHSRASILAFSSRHD